MAVVSSGSPTSPEAQNLRWILDLGSKPHGALEDVKGSSKISRMNNMAKVVGTPGRLSGEGNLVVWGGSIQRRHNRRERTVPVVASILRSACKRGELCCAGWFRDHDGLRRAVRVRQRKTRRPRRLCAHRPARRCRLKLGNHSALRARWTALCRRNKTNTFARVGVFQLGHAAQFSGQASGHTSKHQTRVEDG